MKRYSKLIKPWLNNNTDTVLIVAIIGVAFAVFRLTMAPGLIDLERDTLGHINGLHAGIPIGPTGYPIYVWVVQIFLLFPFESVASRLNFVSVFFGALNAGLMYYTVLFFLDIVVGGRGDSKSDFPGKWMRRLISILATVWYIFSPLFWFVSTITEVYVFNVFMVLWVFLFLLLWTKSSNARFFYLFCFLFGLSLGSHVTNVLLIPGMLVLILIRSPKIWRKPRVWFVGLIVFVIGVAQYIWVPLMRNYPGGNVFEIVTGYFLSWFSPDDLGGRAFAFPLIEIPGRLKTFIEYSIEQFGFHGLILGSMGVVLLLRRRLAWFFCFFINYLVLMIFFSQWNGEDWWTSLTITHLIWAFLISAGLLCVLIWIYPILKRIKNPLRLPIYIAVAVFYVAAVFVPVSLRWEKRDLSKATYLEDFFQKAFELLPPGSQLFDIMTVYGYGEEEKISYYQMYMLDDFDVEAYPFFKVNEVLSGRRFILLSHQNLEEWHSFDESTLEKPIPILYANNSPNRSGLYPLSFIYHPLVLFELQTDYEEILISRDQPAHFLMKSVLDQVVFEGYTINSLLLEQNLFQVDYFWTILDPFPVPPDTKVNVLIDGRAIGEFPLGQNLLTHYIFDHPATEPLRIQDSITMVLPSYLPSGQKNLSIQLCESDSECGSPIFLQNIMFP